ncbi:MAG: hypothetical protein GY708_15020 [Actinomycetia bacterium]|nr:hypothetical protein [Actinomycetes bacterium]MCP3936676.1 hypothetical protein [Actinomycetes bacterium]MCP4963316.1 hypothetical protein [Actinomycetes bacterium]
MNTEFCRCCNRLQHVTDTMVEFVDHGEARSVSWWRCQRCDQLSFTVLEAADVAAASGFDRLALIA